MLSRQRTVATQVEEGEEMQRGDTMPIFILSFNSERLSGLTTSGRYYVLLYRRSSTVIISWENRTMRIC